MWFSFGEFVGEEEEDGEEVEEIRGESFVERVEHPIRTRSVKSAIKRPVTREERSREGLCVEW